MIDGLRGQDYTPDPHPRSALAHKRRQDSARGCPQVPGAHADYQVQEPEVYRAEGDWSFGRSATWRYSGGGVV
jgi:hypothetical protein